MITINKQLGIYMNHEEAHLIDILDNGANKTIVSNFTHEVKEDTIKKNENLMHHKEQHQQSEYYKKIADVVKHYQDILLFGPTEAKAEFHNTIKENHLFSKIKITTKSTDKMPLKEQINYAKEYFHNSL